MLRSTTIIRELATEPGQNYIDIKTFSMVTSLFVMRWCGSMSRYGVRIVCCALYSTQSDGPGIESRWGARFSPLF